MVNLKPLVIRGTNSNACELSKKAHHEKPPKSVLTAVNHVVILPWTNERATTLSKFCLVSCDMLSMHFLPLVPLRKVTVDWLSSDVGEADFAASSPSAVVQL